MAKPGRKVPPRRPLTADMIARQALALADAGGLENLSFRNLAKALKCEAMSIYHYYPSKTHLLDAMVAICVAELNFPGRGVPWQERLAQLARSYRTMALCHPGFFPFLAVYRMNSKAGLTTMESVVSVFQDIGLSPEGQARSFRIFSYYITGACLDETIGYVRGPSAAEPVPRAEAAQQFPNIMSIGKWFAREHHEATFEKGLHVMITGIADILNSEKSKTAG